MKLKDCRESYYYNSGKASDISRQLAFAGLALVWAFRVGSADAAIVPRDMRWAAILLVIGLALDFLQYIVATMVWGVYHRLKEKRATSENQDFLAPRAINYPANTCFFLKQIAVFAAYVFLLSSMSDSFWK